MPELSVLHIDTGESFRGGQRQLLQLIQQFDSQGIGQCLAVNELSPLVSRIGDVPIIKLHSGKFMRRAFPGRIIDYINNHRVQVIHAHDSEAHSIGINLKKSFPELKLIVSRRVVFPPSSKISSRFKYQRNVDAYIAVSKAASEVLTNHGVDAERISVVHSAIDIEAIQSYEKNDTDLQIILSQYPRLIASAGALTEEKDFAVAIQAVHSLKDAFPDVGLVILGEGPERKRLEHLIESQGITNVFLPGHQEPMAPILKCCHAFLLTSTSEGLNNSVIEATACGLPAVVSKVGGLPEIISHGENGFLCQPGRPDSFAGALTTLLGDDSQYERLADNARKISLKFDAAELCKKTVEVYNRVLTV